MATTRASGISTALLTYFQDRPDRVITIDQLMKDLKLSRTQASGNVYNLRSKKAGQDIELLQQGMWRYNSTKKAEEVRPAPGHKVHEVESKTFDILKTTPDGKHMVGTDDEGNIYKISLLA
jgi:hypothetical protein